MIYEGYNDLKVKGLGLSFHTAARLRSLVEILPKTPSWKCRIIDTAPHQTKLPVRLFYRDTVECLEVLLSNPLFKNSIDFSPYRVFTTAERLVRVYREWMSADHAWQLQVTSLFLSVVSILIVVTLIGPTPCRCMPTGGNTFIGQDQCNQSIWRQGRAPAAYVTGKHTFRSP